MFGTRKFSQVFLTSNWLNSDVETGNIQANDSPFSSEQLEFFLKYFLEFTSKTI